MVFDDGHRENPLFSRIFIPGNKRGGHRWKWYTITIDCENVRISVLMMNLNLDVVYTSREVWQNSHQVWVNRYRALYP